MSCSSVVFCLSSAVRRPLAALTRLHDGVAVDELQRLQHVGAVVALALAGLDALRFAEQIENIVLDLGIGQLLGREAGGRSTEAFLHSRGLHQ